MPSFSQRSLQNLNQCHPILVKVAQEAIKTYDFTVVCGYRNEEAQEKAYREGASKAHFGESPHNFQPSLAFDAYSYPIDVNSIPLAQLLGKAIKEAAKRLDLSIEWGGDWKGFKDYPHFQLRNWKQYRGNG